MKSKFRSSAEKDTDISFDLPINHKVGEMILDPDLTFSDHIKRLIKLDQINDANAKKLHKSPKDLEAWIISRNNLTNALMQIEAFLDIARIEKHQDTVKDYAAEFYRAKRRLNKVQVDETKAVFKNKKTILKYLKTPALKQYVRWFNVNYFNKESHQIDKIENQILDATLGQDLVQEVYDAVFWGDMDIGPALSKIRDSKGKPVEYESLMDYMESKDPEVKKAFWAIFTEYIFRKRNSLSALISAKYHRLWQFAHCQEYKTIHNMLMDWYEIPPIVGERIFKIGRKFLREFQWFVNYNDMCAAIQLGQKEITPWDREAGPDVSKTVEISKKEAQEDIIKSLEILGPEYVSILKKVFEEQWIDWDHNPPNKHTNFSYACSSNYREPIKVNFSNDTRTTIILSHEIGHSINSELSKKMGVYQSGCRVLAEVPSFVNETLTFLYYLNEKYNDVHNPEQLVLAYYMLKRLYDNICENCVLQITTNKLEQEYLQVEDLPFERIMTTFRRCKEEFGVLLDTDIRWLRSKSALSCYDIKCLTSIFYNIADAQTIKYLLGATVGVLIAHKIYFEKDQKFINKYLDFLKAGWSKSPLSLLKALGFDITKPETFNPIKDICITLKSVLERWRPNGPRKSDANQDQDKINEVKKLILKTGGKTSSGTKKIIIDTKEKKTTGKKKLIH